MVKTELTQMTAESVFPVKEYLIDRNLLDRVRQTGLPDISIYPFSFPAVVAGRGSRLETEIRLSACVRDNIPVYRRKGGGCAVFLDPGTLIVSMALPARGFAGIQALFNQCNRYLIQGLEAQGLTGIYQDGISDLVLADRKVGGTSLYRSKNLAYYTASLLVGTDLDAMEKYLKHPPREPAYRRYRDHRGFVLCLNRAFPGLAPADLAAGLDRHLSFVMQRRNILDAARSDVDDSR
jgi:lipoate-protein ligase A